MSAHTDAAFRNPGNLSGVLSLSSALRGVRRGMAAPTDEGWAESVTGGIPGIEGEHASLFEPAGLAREVIGNRMEPIRVSIRLFVNVVRSPCGNAEVTEVQVQV
jgi:hypothetical protein